MKKAVVLGAGISGLASAALLAQAGYQVTVLERNTWIGGKSRRVEVSGQRMDTGPALVTFPEVWQQFLATYDALGATKSAPIKNASVAKVEFTKLNEVGRYFFREHETDLPVKENHEWFAAWTRFQKQHDEITSSISTLLTAHPFDPKALPALGKMLKVYGARLTTQSYIKSLKWMPAGLREVIAIHTLNAGVSPKQTLAIYASMTAAMATQGISVPVGGVNEIPQTIAKLAEAAGAKIRLGERVIGVKKGLVTTQDGEYPADLVVSSLDPEVLRVLLGKKPKQPTGKRSCSGVAIYAVLKQPLPAGTVTHSVVMPDEPAELYAALEAAVPPKQTMAFVNYYKAGEVYPNEKPTVAVLLTAPADGKTYDLNSPWVRTEVERISKVMGLDVAIDSLFEDHIILTPEYFGEWGSALGALYGKTNPLWQSGPFHNPQYRSISKPWLRRVGASVHPGGGIPAVLGGTLISLRDLKPGSN
ncbi:phytoene desaturase family protein [Rhodoluna lacicola]|uniref:phytoene desaturase family protein n=1 Tax=Rhodoluna lacicola TaxID=529884 RepID=UPI00222FFA6E|nr:NAD(P)/FAD-dependent oxidoreductase [Rhodoluna lacicola]BDS49817.1 dehydrogenase [Rhodoluna lacicola]